MPRKIYKREFSQERGNPLKVNAADTKHCFALPFPQEFSIDRVILQQVGGTVRVGTFNIYDAPPCNAIDPDSASSESLTADGNPAMHRVIPEQNYAAGVPTELFASTSGGPGWGFANREGSFAVPQKLLYFEITSVAAADIATFDVVIGGEPAVGL